MLSVTCIGFKTARENILRRIHDTKQMLALIPESRDVVEATADHVQMNYDSHSSDIEKAIFAAIKEVVEEVAREKPLFKVSEVLKVGGFNEGTKILSANEFDYLAVLEHLSEPGLLEIEQNQEIPGLVRLKINDIHNQDGKWKTFIQDGYLRCIQIETRSESLLRDWYFENFGVEIIRAFVRIYNESGRSVGLGSNTQLDYKGWPETYSKFASDIERAWIKSAQVKFPNVLLEFVIENRKVEVDLSPAIRYTNVGDCFQTHDCPFPKLADAIMNRGSVLLVGQVHNEFRITFTEIEVDYLNNVMSLKHKKVYIYMKYIANLADEVGVSLFPSYTLKMVCIQHDLQCKRKGDEFLPCLCDVLFLYDYACHLHSLPSIFNTRLDLMKSSHMSSVNEDVRRRVLAYWRKVPELVSKATSRHQHMQDLQELFNECCEHIDMMAVCGDRDNFVEILYSRKDWLFY